MFKLRLVSSFIYDDSQLSFQPCQLCSLFLLFLLSTRDTHFFHCRSRRRKRRISRDSDDRRRRTAWLALLECHRMAAFVLLLIGRPIFSGHFMTLISIFLHIGALCSKRGCHLHSTSIRRVLRGPGVLPCAQTIDIFTYTTVTPSSICCDERQPQLAPNGIGSSRHRVAGEEHHRQPCQQRDA